MNGIINVYKPSGPTSHDIIDKIRIIMGRTTKGRKKVGHAGTLDPLADGVLIVAIGRKYTKKLGLLVKKDKTYQATIKLGGISDTYDAQGKISITGAKKSTKHEISEVLKLFRGETKQVPPPYSAKKIKGQKAYQLARRGIKIQLKPTKITIHTLRLISYRWPYLKIETRVSSGTYIRSLAHDIGQILKTGGYITKLTRTKIGRYRLENSKTYLNNTFHDEIL